MTSPRQTLHHQVPLDPFPARDSLAHWGWRSRGLGRGLLPRKAQLCAQAQGLGWAVPRVSREYITAAFQLSVGSAETSAGESSTATASIFQSRQWRRGWLTCQGGLRDSASSFPCATLSPCQRPRSPRRQGPGCADPFSVWSCRTRRTPSRAARGRWRSRPTAACSCRYGRGAHRGRVAAGGGSRP